MGAPLLEGAAMATTTSAFATDTERPGAPGTVQGTTTAGGLNGPTPSALHAATEIV